MRTTKPERHANLASDFLISRARGDYDAAVGLLADDAVWHSPVEGPRQGRRAIREMFLTHVIGGKHLSRSPDFAAMVMHELGLCAPSEPAQKR